MYSRPSAKETEEDILRLQEDFLKKKSENNVNISAKVVKESNITEASKSQDEPSNPQLQLENTFETIPTDISIGIVVEKHCSVEIQEQNFSHKRGFPQAKRRDPTLSGSKSSSIFSQQMKRFKKDESMEIDRHKTPASHTPAARTKPLSDQKYNPSSSKSNINVPEKSYIVMGEENEEIHKQNVGILQQMTEAEILEEREKLLAMMDPAIVQFLKAKRKEMNESRTVSIAEQNKAGEDVSVEEIEASREVISHPRAEKWLNFDTVETGKLAWMSNVDLPKYEKGKSYDARFDFEGFLLPFVQEIEEKNRILYHHGNEPGRPGYTLQELFQLCRSSVNQQKIIALNTIANILALHQSGVYDGVIDLPLEQIFFMLRVCLDDNTPSILNAAIKAVRNLFFYPIDETCLDNLLGFGLGMVQPITAVNSQETEDDNTENDQQLAERNLVKCLMRTDILKRIRYIINTVRPAIETVVYCLEILMRMARDSDFIVKHIFSCEGLVESIIKYFLPVNIGKLTSTYDSPLPQAVKLFRLLSARSIDNAIQLQKNWKILDSVTTYLSTESLSVNSNGLKLQIESLYLWAIFVHYGLAPEYIRELEPVLWRMLDFHVQNTNALSTTSYIIQSHVAALLNLLSEIYKKKLADMSVFTPMLNGLAATKWLTQFESLQEFTCGKLQIVTSLLKCLIYSLKHSNNCNIEEIMTTLICSQGFNIVTNQIRVGSNLLNNYETHKCSPNLKTLEAAVWNASDHIVPIIQTRSSLPFLCVLSEFIANTTNHQLKLNFLKHDNIQSYLQELNKESSYSLVDNWFTFIENQFIANVLKIAVAVQKNIDTSLFYEIAVKCLSVFTAQQKADIEFVLNNIVFSPRFYPCENIILNLDISDRNDLLRQALNSMDSISKVYMQVLNIKQKETNGLCVDASVGNLMPVDWIYSPIILFYSNHQQNKSNISEDEQVFTVSNCLRWIYIYETYFPSLAKLINPTDRFCRIACTFLASDSLFLIPEIHNLLEACLRLLLASNEKDINFSKGIQGLNNFQDFYTQLLEQYQGVSYGDKLFGNFILLPLIQRHNVKYRKILWSEYAGVLQIFNVTAEEVLCPTELFLNPAETDVSLLKCYRRALVMGIVRKHSFLYSIAKHHVDAYLSNRNVPQKQFVS